MKIKKVSILAVIFIILCGIIIFFLNKRQEPQIQNQEVLRGTYNISREYVALRYRTENVLVEARSFTDYAAWNNEMTDIIQKWEVLEKESIVLEKSANEMAETKVSFNLISPALAYDKQEISNIFDNAPAGKKIATLAKFLGVDAKRANKILQQDQDQVTADAWNEAGDTFQKLETSATVIKDGCKVAVFVGGIVATGGTSALAAGSTLTKAAVIISGADLTLEVTDDAAKISLGNNNKISAIVSDARKVTEPLATIIAISDIPSNLSKGIDKINVAMIAVDQFSSAAQEGKIIGIQLPVYTKDKKTEPIKLNILQKEEVNKWLEERGADDVAITKEELEKILNIKVNPDDATNKEEENQEQLNQGQEDANNSEKEPAELGIINSESQEVEAENIKEEEVEINDSFYSFKLTLFPDGESNDYQRRIRIKLFSSVPIEIKNGKLATSYQTAISEEGFEGTANVRINGTYNMKTGILSGSCTYGWDGVHNKKPEKITYNGTFSQTVSPDSTEVKLTFKGSIETIKLGGDGKPYTTTGEGGPIMNFYVDEIKK